MNAHVLTRAKGTRGASELGSGARNGSKRARSTREGNRVKRARPDRDPHAQPSPPDFDPQDEPGTEASASLETQKKIRRRKAVAKVLAGAESIAMLAATATAAAVLAAAWETSQSELRVIPGVTLAGESIAGLDRDALESAAAIAGERTLDRALTLSAGPASVHTSARALGAEPAPADVVEQALAFGRSGDLLADLRARSRARAGSIDLRVGMRFEQGRALEQLLALAPDVDTMSTPMRFDLEARKVIPAERGTALLPYDSLSSVALGLAAGSELIELAIAQKPAVADPLADRLAQYDIDKLELGVVLGSFSTPYSMEPRAADRTANLKVGAAVIDNYVLMPGETFSFNAIVGERSAENGYRWAPGISGGQIIDVLGGGICQLASTVFGAAFFSGLEVVRARPHSRPSGYVDMGLDATVVWDTVDLAVRNPFEFPVVLHMNVSQGQVRGEILGPKRPYQVAFERSLIESMDYETVYRTDPKLLTGAEVVAQRGMRGFKVERVRKLYQGGEVADEQTWELTYPATREIIRVGTNPAGENPEPRKFSALRDPAASMRIMQ